MQPSRRNVPNETPTYSRAQRRASNEGRRDAFGLTHRQIAFVCECDLPACYDTVLLTASEYDERRLHSGSITTAGHDVSVAV